MTAAITFYAEVNPLPANPTDFVRLIIYPLLEHDCCSMQETDITREFRAFLTRFKDSFVLYDHPSDGKLFRLQSTDSGLRHIRKRYPSSIRP